MVNSLRGEIKRRKEEMGGSERKRVVLRCAVRCRCGFEDLSHLCKAIGIMKDAGGEFWTTASLSVHVRYFPVCLLKAKHAMSSVIKYHQSNQQLEAVIHFFPVIVLQESGLENYLRLFFSMTQSSELPKDALTVTADHNPSDIPHHKT